MKPRVVKQRNYSGIQVAAVKESIGAYAGICLHPAQCRKMIYNSVQRALKRFDGIKPLCLEGNEVEMEMRFTTASAVDRALRLPGTERLSGDTLVYRATDYAGAFQAFTAITDLMELVPFI